MNVKIFEYNFYKNLFYILGINISFLPSLCTQTYPMHLFFFDSTHLNFSHIMLPSFVNPTLF